MQLSLSLSLSFFLFSFLFLSTARIAHALVIVGPRDRRRAFWMRMRRRAVVHLLICMSGACDSAGACRSQSRTNAKFESRSRACASVAPFFYPKFRPLEIIPPFPSFWKNESPPFFIRLEFSSDFSWLVLNMEFFSHFIVPPIINCILFRCYTGLRRDLNEAAVRGGEAEKS